ncbi:MAG: hypothetical protein U5L04_11595 [Trueperaceae bacterium]|nr:hypothetical protein [Trueperaceae bacterium]
MKVTTRLALRSLASLSVGFIGRFRTNDRVLHQRLPVTIPEVDLLITWKAQDFGWHLSVLISTITGGVQELMRT